MTAPQLSSGQTCQTCGRRLPHPKKPTTPDTRPISYRVPNEEVAPHRDVLKAAAEHLGVHSQPYWQFKTVTLALAHLLQDATLKDYGAGQ